MTRTRLGSIAVAFALLLAGAVSPASAGTKRGTHLALTLERLTALAPDAPQRIGLSATQRPLEEIARFLGGCEPPSAAAVALITPRISLAMPPRSRPCGVA